MPDDTHEPTGGGRAICYHRRNLSWATPGCTLTGSMMHIGGACLWHGRRPELSQCMAALTDGARVQRNLTGAILGADGVTTTATT